MSYSEALAAAPARHSVNTTVWAIVEASVEILGDFRVLRMIIR